MRPAGPIVPVYAALLTAVVLGPLAAPGYLLLRDAVSTPRSWLPDSALGLGGTAPRAVPQDAAMAALSAVLDGGVVVKTLLAAGLLLAGWGAGRLAGLLLPDAGLPGQLVATTLAIWNPYVAERLLQGHWSLLVGYGCLPWVAAAVLRVRTGGGWPGWAELVFFTALAGLTPTGLILAAVVGLVGVAAPGGRRWPSAVGVSAVAALAASPWLVASALGGALGTPQTDGLAPFAARAEPGLGTLGSLAGLAGIWNAEATPASRGTLAAAAGTVLLLAVVVAGLPAVARRPAAVPLLVLAAAAVLLPAAAATGPGLAVLRSVVEAVPGLAVLRDGQKWVALAMPGYALAAAGATLPRPRPRFRRANSRSATETAPKSRAVAVRAAVCCAVLIAALPDLAWGVWGRVTPAHYPPGWAAAAAVINAEPATVAVLPADAMRRFAWTGPAPVLDPLPRWLRADVLVTGDVAVSGRTVAGEGGRARAVQDLLIAGADPAEVRRAGVGWVVLERGTAGVVGDAAATLDGLPVAYADADLAVYRVGGDSPGASRGTRLGVLAAHLVWAGMLLAGAAGMAVAAVRGRQSGGCP